MTKQLICIFLLAFIALASCFSLIKPLTLKRDSSRVPGVLGICTSPTDANAVYACAPQGGIYRLSKTTGEVLGGGPFVSVLDAEGCDDCAFTKDGKYILWTGLFTNYIKSKDVTSGTVVKHGTVNMANGVACRDNSRCFVGTFPALFAGSPGQIYEFNVLTTPPNTPAGSVKLFFDMAQTGSPFTCGLNGFDIRASDNTAFGTSCTVPFGTRMDVLIKFNVNSPQVIPEIISTGWVDAQGTRLSPDGNTLFVLDLGHSAVWAVNISGSSPTYARTLVAQIRNPAYLDQIAVGSDGTLFMADSVTASIFATSTSTPFPNPYTLLGVSASDTPTEVMAQVALPGQLHVTTNFNLLDTMTPIQKIPLFFISSLLSVEIWLADYYSIRSISIATPNTAVVAAGEFGLQQPFGTASIQVRGDYVYHAAHLTFQIRDRYKNIPVFTTSAPPPIWRPTSMSFRVDDTLLLSEWGFPFSDGVTYPIVGSSSTFTSPGYTFLGNVPNGIYHITGLSGSTSSPVFTPVTVLPANVYNHIIGVVADLTNNNIAYFVDFVQSALVKLDLTTGTTTVLLSTTTNVTLTCPTAVGIGKKLGKTILYVIDAGADRIVSYTIYGGSGVGAVEIPSSGSSGIPLRFGREDFRCPLLNPNITKPGPGFVLSSIDVNPIDGSIVFSSDVDLALYLAYL